MKTSHLVLAAAALLPAARAQNPLLTWTGPQNDIYYGTAVDSAGDVNADGYDDVLVGGSYYTNGSFFYAGMVRVYSGYDGEMLIALYGTHAWQNLGRSVAGLGDINQDGHDDFVVGAMRDNTSGTNAGAAFVYSGKTGAKLFSFYAPGPECLFGYDVACAGDVNADGRPDILVGAIYEDVLGPLMLDAGRARVYSGANGALLLTMQGAVAGATLGWSVDGAGDVDGDGRDDVVLGSLGNARAEVRSGLDGHVIFTRTGAVLDEYGYDVAGVGDVNGDGLADVAVGAPQWNGDMGKCEVLLGPAGALKWTVTGVDADDGFGVSVDGTGDIDKDGFGDFIVGGAGFDFDRGMARVHSGRTGGVLYGTLQGDDWDDSFGISVAGAGDTNGDGWLDVLVGAPQAAADGKGYARSFDVLVNAQNLGFGGPGNATLKMYGSPLNSFGEMDLSLKGAAPNKQAMLIAAIGQMPISVKGGILVPDISAAILVPFVTSAQGKLLIPGIPGGGGPLNVHVQCVVKDPAQPQGWAFSNAIRPQFLP